MIHHGMAGYGHKGLHAHFQLLAHTFALKKRKYMGSQAVRNGKMPAAMMYEVNSHIISYIIET